MAFAVLLFEMTPFSPSISSRTRTLTFIAQVLHADYGGGGLGGGMNAPQYYSQPPMRYLPQNSVPLSRIPYTGFDYGPMGDLLYWLGLILFAISGSYLLVYYMPLRQSLAMDATGVVRAILRRQAIAWQQVLEGLGLT
jgi:hypothetical protein